VLEKIMADKPEITGSVMNDVISANPEKLESITKDNEDLLTNIVKTVVAEASDGDESIGNIISKASPDITSKMMTEITETKQELAAQVIAQVSENNPNKISEIFDSSEELAASLTEAVANSIVNDVDGSDTFKKIFVAADAKVLSKVSAAVNQQDSSITQKAVSELIIEDKEVVKNVIKKAAKAGANDIAESTMKTAILQGETTMVQEAVIELTQETTNQNNNASSASIQQADDIEEELIDPISNLSNSLNNSIAQAQEENPEVEILIEEEIIVNLNTVLASPS
jgi:urease accessory protein UreF